METIAERQTEHGRRDLAQLCKHFAHQVEVTHSDDRGECRFSCGTAILADDDESLTIRASAV